MGGPPPPRVAAAATVLLLVLVLSTQLAKPASAKDHRRIYRKTDGSATKKSGSQSGLEQSEWLVQSLANAKVSLDVETWTRQPRSVAGPKIEVVAVRGRRVVLPCDVKPPTEKDSPILVLFYHGAIGKPIYSIDARGGSLARAVHWLERDVLGERAHFDVASEPQGLLFDEVEANDAGEYRCRVDFRSSPTRNLRIQLRVVVPPTRVSIISDNNLEVTGLIGPYPLGSSLNLSCQVKGGIPTPRVMWWYEGRLLDDVSEVISDMVTTNTLTLPHLSREHLYRVITCQASNSNLTAPLAAAVTIDMSFPPSRVEILGSGKPLSEGRRYSIVCEASGSRPTATLTWYKNGVLMTDTLDQILNDGDVSRSTLHLTPTRKDDEAELSCKASNPNLSQVDPIVDIRIIQVYYKPKLYLRAGQSLDMSDIEEEDDVYFECSVQANPSISRVQWFQNGIELIHNVSVGVIQSNLSLVLQGVGRASSGLYTCHAHNIEGTGRSNAVHLNVKYSPVCVMDKPIVYGGGRHRPVNVTCRVHAHPEAHSFRWAFNNSAEVVDIPESRYESTRSRSVVAYTPRTHLDFGSLLCWAGNDVGMQKQPCVFHVQPADVTAVPEQVHNCSVSHNGSAAGAVEVECQPGWDGGLAQSFTLEVRNVKGHILAVLKRQPLPQFSVTGLAPGTEYVLSIVASNAHGGGEPTTFAHLTPIDIAERRTSPSASSPGMLLTVTPILAVLTGVVTSLAICAVVLVLVVRAKTKAKAKEPAKMLFAKKTPSNGCEEGGFVDSRIGPDVMNVSTDPKTVEGEKEMQPKGSLDYLQQDSTSFFINPGTLLSNAPPEELDALLVDNRQPRPHHILPPSAMPPIASVDTMGRSSGRGTPSSATESHRGSTSTVALHPDYYTSAVVAEHPDCVRLPLVVPPVSSPKESSV